VIDRGRPFVEHRCPGRRCWFAGVGQASSPWFEDYGHSKTSL
jgi:hypothetical protein